MKNIFTRYGLIVAIALISIIVGCTQNTNNPDVPDTTGMTDQELLSELNAARTNPAQYAQYLESLRKYYDGNLYKVPGEITLQTNEGIGGLNNAIQFLKSATPRSALRLSNGLMNAARDHVQDTGPKGISGHTGSNGSTLDSRISRYGKWNIKCGENIAYGPKTARDAIIQLIIDDGNTSRGHRENIFEEKFKFVGTTSGVHKTHKTMAIQVFAAEYTE